MSSRKFLETLGSYLPALLVRQLEDGAREGAAQAVVPRRDEALVKRGYLPQRPALRFERREPSGRGGEERRRLLRRRRRRAPLSRLPRTIVTLPSDGLQASSASPGRCRFEVRESWWDSSSWTGV